MASPYFSEARAIVAIAMACALLLSGCVMVRPDRREHLARRSMTFGSEGGVSAQEEHVLSNREGASGAGSSTGGGCGCN